MKGMTLGSLFDGSGGFPLAGAMNGMTPVWASEIEPYPMRVTAARFPAMKQLGDVTKIDGAGIEPVDVITFGSPCQDLSVAGKQTGIHDGKRSSLFSRLLESSGKCEESPMENTRDLPCGRTSQAHLDRMPALTSKPSCKRSAKSEEKPFLYLNLRRGNGQRPDASWETVTALPGASMTLNTGECPSEERESTLSQILEANAPEKYCLSAKACAGILRRAEKRGKELPTMLREALEEVVMLTTSQV